MLEIICGTRHPLLAPSTIPCVAGAKASLSQKPLLLGIWVHPRLWQREALRERVGRQKGGGALLPAEWWLMGGIGQTGVLQQQDTVFLPLYCHQHNKCATKTWAIISCKMAAGVV